MLSSKTFQKSELLDAEPIQVVYFTPKGYGHTGRIETACGFKSPCYCYKDEYKVSVQLLFGQQAPESMLQSIAAHYAN